MDTKNYSLEKPSNDRKLDIPTHETPVLSTVKNGSNFQETSKTDMREQIEPIAPAREDSYRVPHHWYRHVDEHDDDMGPDLCRFASEGGATLPSSWTRE